MPSDFVNDNPTLLEILKSELKSKKNLHFALEEIVLKNLSSLKEIENIIRQGIKINIIGEINKLSSNIKLTLKKTIKLTKKKQKDFS